MRSFRGPPPPAGRGNSINLAVLVEEYLEIDGAVGVRGQRLETEAREPVIVTLTDYGELAENEKRPPLMDFRDHKNKLGVDIGGVIGFDRCHASGTDGRFLAGWPVRLAGNGSEEQWQRLRINRNATLEIGRARVTRRLFGRLAIWQAPHITALGTLGALEKATQRWIDRVPLAVRNTHGSAVMRARNAAGEVVAYARVCALYDSKIGSYESGAATLERFKKDFEYNKLIADASAGLAVGWDIVPAVNIDLAPRSLADNAEVFLATAKSFLRDGELIAKGTTFLLDPKCRFVVKAMAHDPFGDSGIDPALLGKDDNHLAYNETYLARMRDGVPATPLEEPQQSEQEYIYAPEALEM